METAMRRATVDHAVRTFTQDSTPEERGLVRKIVNRYSAVCADVGMRLTRSQCITLEISLLVCNANGCPMDFDAMLAGRDQDLAHDVAGIDHHIDRITGELQDCFWPRYARPSK